LGSISDLEDADDVDQPNVEVPFLNGTQCNLLLQHFCHLFSLRPGEKKIWILTRYLFQHWIDASAARIAQQNMETLKKTLNLLQKLLKKCFPLEKFSFYWHIVIAHLPQLIAEHQSVSQFSNQGMVYLLFLTLIGTEAIHFLAQTQYTQTSNNGAVSQVQIPTSALKQVYFINTRRYFPSFGHQF